MGTGPRLGFYQRVLFNLSTSNLPSLYLLMIGRSVVCVNPGHNLSTKFHQVQPLRRDCQTTKLSHLVVTVHERD